VASQDSPFVCVGLFLFHLGLIWQYAVNIPAWDDLTLIYDGHPGSLTFQWLFEQAVPSDC